MTAFSKFFKRYVVGLSIEVILGTIDWLTNLLPLSFLGRSLIFSAASSLWVLFETWRDTSTEQRPSLIQTFMLWWPSGTIFLWIFFHLLHALNVPSGPRSTPVPPPTTGATPTPIVLPGTAALSSSPTLVRITEATPTPIVLVVTVTPSPSPTLPYKHRIVCADAPPSPFTIGQKGYICNSDGIRLREKPSLRAGVSAVIPPSTTFVIIGGPECGDRRAWWKIRTTGNDKVYLNGHVGWMAETSPGGDERYICPLP